MKVEYIPPRVSIEMVGYPTIFISLPEAERLVLKLKEFIRTEYLPKQQIW